MSLRSGRHIIMSTSIPRIVFIDFETTGLNPFKDDIIEIAAIDNLGHSYQTLVNSGKKIPTEASAIHGITNEMVAKEGIETKTALLNLLMFIAGKIDDQLQLVKASYIVGHNICHFDIPFLQSCIERCNECHHTKYTLPTIRVIDTMRMSQCYTDNRVHNLMYLSKVYSIPLNGAHRAMADIQATKTLFDRIMTDKGLKLEMIWKQTRLYGF